MRIRGVTLLELLVALTLIAMVMGAVTSSYIVSMDYEQRLRESRMVNDRYRTFEDRLSNLLMHAYLSADGEDASSYFIGADVQAESASGTPTESLTFTIAGTRIPSTLMNSQDDFETLNGRVGPQGGVAEITLGRTPIGQAPNRNGLFLREQRPSDGDPSQGGMEEVFSDEIESIQFEFYDGTQWLPNWDTRTGQKRLPSAVRVTYQMTGDETDHVIVTKLPLSDVTPLNPLQTETDQ